MSSPSLECSRCGAGIPEEALETGTAISVLGKNYCADCKGKAVQDISLDELMEGSSPPPKPPPQSTARPASKAVPPPATPAPTPRASPAPRRPETARLRVAQLRRPSRLPIVLGALAAVAAVAVTAFLVGGKPKPEPPVKPPVKPPATATTPEDPPKPPPDSRAEKAQVAFTAAEIAARRSDAGFDEILAVLEKARPDCKGTPYESKLEELRNRVLKEKELVEGTRQLNPLIEKLRAAVAADPGFARFAELVPQFEKARELAARTSPQKLSELNAIQQDYFGRYEKEAERHYPEIREYAEQVADEKRYDLALKKIETFPSQLRHSGAWRSLEKLKQDIERRKGASK